MGLAVRLKKAVKGFTLEAAWEIGNELAVLFGYSGAGKSMTLQMIAGLMTPDEGRVQVDDCVLFDSGARINVPPNRRALGYVFQDLALFPHMTVSENIAYGLNGTGRHKRREEVGALVDTFRLNGLEHKYPAEISGGQKQRVAFARALIRRPPVLLLDEPFSALDTPLRMEMRMLLKEIRRDFDLPVVLVTHDLAEAAFLADTMIVYTNGRVAQAGAPAAVMANPADPGVAALVASCSPAPSP
ncbi:MAG: ATP-binding cassette domain-containing protein [Nitrospirota bacterium]